MGRFSVSFYSLISLFIDFGLQHADPYQMPAIYCTLIFVTIFITVQIGTAQRLYVCERHVMAMQSAVTTWGFSGFPGIFTMTAGSVLQPVSGLNFTRDKKVLKGYKMKSDREFDELLRKKISEILEEPIDESIDADDLMFDLGMRYFKNGGR